LVYQLLSDKVVSMTQIDPIHDQPASRVTAMPLNANPDGDIFGGWVMSQMDLAAASVAARRANGRVVTVAVDGMAFLSPIFIGDEVSIYANISRVGRTSLAVKVEAYARRQYTEDTDKVTEAIFTFVKIGQDRKPRPLPPG
jgi:acyl-CoA thioesterase YciA